MTAKFRHAAKTEHYKYEFNERTGRVNLKEEEMHYKGMPEKDFLIALMMR